MDKLADQPSINVVAGVAILLGVLAMIGIAIWRAVRDLRRSRLAREALLARELAVIEEDIRSTGAGVLSTIMVFVVLFGSITAYAAAKTVFQQIEAGVTLIAGLILFGLGAALGRRRRYVVYRSQNREPM